MRRVRWTLSAAGDLESIGHFLARDHPEFLQATIAKLYLAAHSLSSLPNRGRPGREPGTRELILPPLPYIVVYRVRGESVEILHIHHSAKDRP